MTYTAEYSNRPEQREDSHLVVLLHGYGSNERDLLGLTPHLPNQGMTYVALRAPQPVGAPFDAELNQAYIPGSAMGYQWYSLDQRLNTNVRGVELASDYVLRWLDDHAGIYSDITLLGFSQGMAVATSVARHRPTAVKAVIGLSGYVIETQSNYFDNAAVAAAQIPLFYGRDQADPVIPEDKVAFTLEYAGDHFETTKRLYSGMGHGVNAQEIGHVAEFIEQKVMN
ncbi:MULTISPECIES: alpha/beta hydrolase [unclassified Rothia (in: high G+C Gram-positive bacteria)]|uniref:alpha/beta hydrolase n=1 Tax=unclassified Rothia (in: high G+C Gram-positive bacteria) TaxID=2689056 RepID=UPI00195EFB48|nr:MULTISPECIES: phospholipase [unclassified Rothia (in: high G+C Gram-positive bacteria)]MBM7051351.1 phospholipase [Rothia sp. ZJ1223]QRZ61145.1 phospholipase [Rothia sp. ZJ932]